MSRAPCEERRRGVGEIVYSRDWYGRPGNCRRFSSLIAAGAHGHRWADGRAKGCPSDHLPPKCLAEREARLRRRERVGVRQRFWQILLLLLILLLILFHFLALLLPQPNICRR